jgi:hypothetical protein
LGWAYEVTGGQWGWTTFVMPFVDQSNLYNAAGVSTQTLQDFLDAHLASGATSLEGTIYTTFLSVWACPSDTGPNINDRKQLIQGVDWHPAKSNYVGNAGVINTVFGMWYEGDGIFGPNSSWSIRDIPDGTSNTLMVGERKYADGYGAGAWYGVGFFGPKHVGYEEAGVLSVVGSTVFPPNVLTDVSGNDLSIWTRLMLSSEHVGGGQFVFADGSVHFINENIDRGFSWIPRTFLDRTTHGVWEHLAIRHDGQVVGSF